MVPSRLEPRFNLFLFYQKTNNIQLARDLAIQIRDMKIKVPSEKATQIKELTNKFLTNHQNYENKTNLFDPAVNAAVYSNNGTGKDRQ